MSDASSSTTMLSSSTTTSATTTTTTFSLIMESLVLPLLWRGSGLMLGIVALVGGLLYVKQDSLLYMPVVAGIPRRNIDNPRGYQSPAERHVDYRSLRIPCRDGVVIHAWLLLYTGPTTTSTSTSSTSASSTTAQPPPFFSETLQQQQQKEPQRLPTIICFHGNAGNIGLRLPIAVSMMQHTACHVLLVEYRGYGDSDNVTHIDETGIQQDAMAVLDYVTRPTTTPSSQNNDNDNDNDVQRYIDSSQLFLFGQSLGGAVAFYLAHYALEHSIPGIVGIVVENTFTSISDMVNVIFPPFLAPVKHLILRIGSNSAQIVPKIVQGRIPILFLAGAKDQLVPHHHMLTLHQLALQAATNKSSKQEEQEHDDTTFDGGRRRVQMHVIPNGTHNESWYQGGRAYWKAMANFVQQTRTLAAAGGGALSSTSTTATTAATTRSDSTASSTASSASSSQQPASSSISIPTMSSRLLDIAKETIRGHGVVVVAANAAACQAAPTAEKNDKKNM
jgi:abhydrolase domain-containing protein 13